MTDLHQFELDHIHEAMELSSESDRGCVLVAAAMLDTRLEAAIRAKLADAPALVDKLVMNNGPIAQFSHRIDFANVLGLIPNREREALHMVRKIRNDAAHTDRRFRFDAHADRCRALAERMAISPGALTAAQHFLGALALLLIGLDRTLPAIERVTDTAVTLDSVDRVEFVARHLPMVLRERLQKEPGKAISTAGTINFASQVFDRFGERDED